MVWGREDRIVPVDHAEALPSNVRVEILEATGHMPNAERADAFNALLLDRIVATEKST